MAISVVQFKGGSTTSAASVTINLGTPTTVGNALVATVTGGGASVTTITGGGGTAVWGSASGIFNSDIGFSAIWALQGVAAAGTAITITQNAANVMGVYVYEVSGLVTTGAVDKVSSQAQDTAGTIYNSGTTATTTVANEFWVGMAGGYGLDFATSYPVLTAPAGFTVQPQQNITTAVFHNSGYQIVSSTGAAVYSGTDTNHTADTGMNVVAAVATFKGATSTGITSTGTMVGAPGVFTAFTPAGPITSTGTMVEVTGVMTGLITPPTITTTGTMVGAPQVMAGLPPNTSNPSWDPTGSYTLIFDEDFLGSSLDTTIWTLGWQATSGISGPINAATTPGVDGEAAAYNSNHVVVSDSILSLELTQTNIVSGGVTYPYTGSCITSNPATLGGSDGFQFTGGAVEFYANLPAGTVGSATVIANWPALWLDGQNWPVTGEIDVMEGLGGTVQWHCWSTLNQPGVGAAAPGQGDGTDVPYFSPYAGGWHKYGATWDPTASPSQIDWYYDGVLVGTLQTGTNFDSPMYLILNNTTGWQSGPELAGTVQVDWVKVWQPASTPATTPPVSELADNFASASTLQTKWCASGNVSTTGGTAASIATDANYDGFLLSGTTYNLTGGTYYQKVVPGSGAQIGMYLTDLTQNNGAAFYNSIAWDYDSDAASLVASITQAGVTTTIATLTYSATTHAWWRVAESGGTVTWYTSTNGTTWSSQGTHARTMESTALWAYTFAGNEDGGSSNTLISQVNGGAAPVTTSGGMAGSAGFFNGNVAVPIPSVSTSGGLQGFVETMAGSANAAGPVFTTSGGMAAQPFTFQGVTSANNSNAATLTVTPSFSATPSRGQPSSATLTVTPNLGSFILDESGSSLDDEGGSNIWDQQGAASATVTHFGIASLTVTPNFTAVAKHGNARQASLTVTPSQTVTTLRVQVATASLTVTPVFVVNTNHNNNHNTGGSLTVTPTFSVTTTHGYFRTASLTETPAFTNTVLHTQFRTATLTVTPAFTNSRQLTQVSSGSLTATPAFNATGLRTQFQTSSLTVLPAFDAERQITQVFSASLTVIPSFAVTRVYTHNVTATVEIPLGQFPTTVHGHFPSASLAVNPQFTIVAQKTGQGHEVAASPLTVTPSITSAGVRHVQFRTAVLTVTPNIPNASPTHGRFRTATLTVTPSGSATPLHTQFQTASLVVSPQQTVTTQFAQVDTASLTTSPVFLTNFSHNGANHNSAVALLTVTPVLSLVSRLHGHNPTATLTVTPIPTSTYQHTQFRTASVTATPVIPSASVLHTQYTSASVTVTPRRFTNRIRTGFSSGNLVITPEFDSTQQYAQVAQALLEVDPVFTVTLEGGSITGTVEFILGQPFFEWTTGPVRT